MSVGRYVRRVVLIVSDSWRWENMWSGKHIIEVVQIERSV